MTATRLCACVMLALGCGSHDTPVAAYITHLPESPDGGHDSNNSADSGTDDDGGAGATQPHCMQTYTTIAAGLTSHYKEVSTARSWVDAERDCESDGAHLIVIGAQKENDWLASIAKKSVTNDNSSNQLSWIGLGDSQTEGTFRWVSPTAAHLALWARNEPSSLYGDEDCVEMRASGQWNDDHCDAKLSYVCECDGSSSAHQWCDASKAETCGDCHTACPATKKCVHQRCQ